MRNLLVVIILLACAFTGVINAADAGTFTANSSANVEVDENDTILNERVELRNRLINTLKKERSEVVSLLQVLGESDPFTYDTIAARYPEYFVPGKRRVMPAFHPKVLLLLQEPGEGFSINPFTGVQPNSGVMVSIDGVEPLVNPTVESMRKFIKENAVLLSREDVYLGGWRSELSGDMVIELSRRIEDLATAIKLGKDFDQEGVYSFELGYIATRGEDKLKASKGFGDPEIQLLFSNLIRINSFLDKLLSEDTIDVRRTEKLGKNRSSLRGKETAEPEEQTVITDSELQSTF